MNNDFSGTAYQISESGNINLWPRLEPSTRTQDIIRIDNFSSFVKANAKFESKLITVYDAEWFIGIELCNYCEVTKRYITQQTSSTDRAEFLQIYVRGDYSGNDSLLFALNVITKFKRKLLPKKFWFVLETNKTTRELIYNTKNGIQIKIDVRIHVN